MTTVRYEAPQINLELTKDDIHRRYQDIALLIFQEQQNNKDVINYLTIGTSRRTVEYSNYGNDPVIIRRSQQQSSTPAMTTAIAVTQSDRRNISTQILKLYRKPSRENCTII
ncbi:hypothetical protein PV325_008210 [Microctonus aethiopoides]|uniref:Uncharacterized protein n=1 Tax=Microctonus aethiopoides TaxID=144406 RepID=A0AA39C9F7_9HYME|nr:hypothetical protein PV326_012874 [Microctonus aethiopoides]KAK0089270.1 hypothetical protein PV325_008210 [Microctonus aethiopoides]KAK0159950.1 hypothetical protein PV328_007405 [Microctonus aethiopoides]